jgi:hypothetical protein
MIAIVKCVRFLVSCLDLITECKKKEKEKKYFMNKNLLKIFALRRARIPFCISVSFLFSEINILSKNV